MKSRVYCIILMDGITTARTRFITALNKTYYLSHNSNKHPANMLIQSSTNKYIHQLNSASKEKENTINVYISIHIIIAYQTKYLRSLIKVNIF